MSQHLDLDPIRQVLVKPLHHLEQVRTGSILMRENERSQARRADRLVEESSLDVCRAALLATLENDRPNLAFFCYLRL